MMMNDKQDDVLVIGAGASGMMAAIAAARAGAKVRIVEKEKRPGRKLLLTGNGRCNLTNLDPDLPFAYHSVSDAAAAKTVAQQVLGRFGVPETLRFFEELGLMIQDRDGCVYPASGQAQSVLNVLTAELERLKVRTNYNSEAAGLKFDKDMGAWLVKTPGWTYCSKAVIVSGGSRAGMPGTFDEKKGGVLTALRKLGHSVTDPQPALTALHCTDPDIRMCEGARTRALVVLSDGRTGQEAARDEGELQWTASEISGIPAFNVSRFAYGISKSCPMTVSVDLLPGYEEEKICARLADLLCRTDGSGSLTRLMSGFTHEKVAAYLVKRSGLADSLRRPDVKAGGDAYKAAAARLAALIKHLSLTVDAVREVSRAQICIGGISLAEVDACTLESVFCPGLYLTGEILDIDGPCGGYNLQWAWSSGMTAGMAAGQIQKM